MKTINPIKKMSRYTSFPFLSSCFPTALALDYPHAPPPTTTTTATTTTATTTTTCVYQTHLGLFSISWSRSGYSRSLHLHLHLHLNPSLSSPVFHLTLKPLIFWNKHGHKKLSFPSKSIWVFWDFTNARFGSRPDPDSGFYIAIVSDGHMTLLIGDLETEAYSKTKSIRTNNRKNIQSLVIRREHVFGNRFYTTRTEISGKSRLISIELNSDCEEDPRLIIRFDSKRVLQVNHLKWKFRGSERIEVDGYPIQFSWDVYNWLFTGDSNQSDGYALFTFRFEKQGIEIDFNEEERETRDYVGEKEKLITLSQDSCGLNYERKMKNKKKKRLLMKTRSSSSSSLSSVSSGCNSVMEWESVEENELKGPTGFSLLIYAWKS